ncbi:hypothetical protein NLJ89_g7322 [Agrocybe chaxingu]|uniref:Uncharacterized protein n=1 Tax=Agrocybe chaxingu TaxID=84603 RepID=A0A9W8JWX1_9AGAR|nr:hypothetical protein NLJ89_g7322 [Agrocybe chaxingu]
MQQKANGHAGIEDDVDSNVQDGIRSEIGEMMGHEPGPNDPPGVKYASYDSGPSFGNFGPLPTEDLPPASNPYAGGGWKPVWGDIVNGEGEGNLTSGQPRNGPASEHAATPRQTLANMTPKVPERDIMASPKPPSRAQSRAAEADQRPWSPMSGRSKMTRATEKGTVYPPLPLSVVGEGEGYGEGPNSPSQRVQMFSSKPQYNNGGRSPPPGPASIMSGGAGHHNRPFSPYRHAPTQEDLLNAAVRGRSLAIPPSPEKEPSVVSQTPSKMSRARSHAEGRKTASQISVSKQLSQQGGSRVSRATRSEREQDRDRTPTPTRPHSPEGLDAEEARIVNEALAARTPRTSFYAASLEPEATSHFHDMELCVLLQQENDPAQHDIVKKALRKAVRQRIKKLGMKKSYHDHDPSVHLRHDYVPEEPPRWAADLKRELVLMQQRIESLGPKIEGLKQDRSFNMDGSRFAYEPDESTRTPMTQTVNIQTQPTGTLADSMYQQPESEHLVDEDHQEYDDRTETQTQQQPYTDGETRSVARSAYDTSDNGRDHSGGEQVLEEQLYRLRQRPAGSQLGSHKSWEVAQEEDHDFEDNGHVAPSGLPTIPDTNGDDMYEHERELPELPEDANPEMAVHPQGPWAVEYNTSKDPSQQPLPPWQRIHARLLGWAIIWPLSELENALNSTTRGQQVDEVALSIWSTQTYKRYVRARLTDTPQGAVDRLFVPPNIADAISNAVFNGRHGDACGMLKDLWAPFGLEGMPRLIVVLAKHRSDPNHWVVHRFCLPDGSLTTYDSYPERTLPDGRPLGWWFAIRVAWPNAMYPSPDHLVQKMVRLHRPLQLPIDNSVAAAGIWRNILMGSRAERSLDLERLRDLINTEVKNLKQRKQMGKLSIGTPKPAWDDMV